MLEFCGQEQCVLDGNGRIKLSTALLRNFKRYTDGEVVLHCLPEGAIAVYPPHIWKAMRGQESDREAQAANSVVYRRLIRRFGAMSQGAAISNQGRVTIPPSYREYADLVPNSPISVVGCEIGVEIWNPSRWGKESELIHQHVFSKGENEMSIDVSREDS